MPTHRSRDLSDRFDGPDFVVRKHNAHESCTLRHRPGHVFRIDQAEFVNGEIGDIESELFQLVAGVKHRMVFDAGGDNVVANVPESGGDPFDGGVVRFGAP